MHLVIGDRATAAVGKEELNVANIAVETAKAWFRENLRRVDPDRHLSYQVELKPARLGRVDEPVFGKEGHARGQ
jgi:S-adenosylmethionine synthetase